jgi:uncharacterized secreted protein with C-terminal beta-propeller domain
MMIATMNRHDVQTGLYDIDVPHTFVPGLLECLLNSFDYDESNSRLRLVTDVPKWRPEIDREFLALDFFGAHDFHDPFGHR